MLEHDFGIRIHIDTMIMKECNKVNISYHKIAIFNSMRKKFNFNNENK